MMNKDFSPDDRVRLKNDGTGETSPIPHMSCEQARQMAETFEQGELSAGETLLLSFHLLSREIEPAIPHTDACPSNDASLKDQVKAALRDSGE